MLHNEYHSVVLRAFWASRPTQAIVSSHLDLGKNEESQQGLFDKRYFCERSWLMQELKPRALPASSQSCPLPSALPPCVCARPCPWSVRAGSTQRLSLFLLASAAATWAHPLLIFQALLRQITFSLFLDLFSISPQVSSLGLRNTNVSHKLALNLPLFLCLPHITLRLLLTSAWLPQASFPLPFLISWNLLLWLLLFRHLSSCSLTLLLLTSSVVNSTMIWAVHASQVEYTSLSDASLFLLPECGSCLASPEDLAVLTLETYKQWLVSLAHLLLKATVSLNSWVLVVFSPLSCIMEMSVVTRNLLLPSSRAWNLEGVCVCVRVCVLMHSVCVVMWNTVNALHTNLQVVNFQRCECALAVQSHKSVHMSGVQSCACTVCKWLCLCVLNCIECSSPLSLFQVQNV